MAKEEYRTDPLTGEQFIPRRSNQIFKSRANQVKYNNEKAKKVRKVISPTQSAFRRNYQILRRIMQTKKPPIVTRDYLEGAGFDFDGFTGVNTIRPVFSAKVFDINLIQLDDNSFTLELNK